MPCRCLFRNFGRAEKERKSQHLIASAMFKLLLYGAGLPALPCMLLHNRRALSGREERISVIVPGLPPTIADRYRREVVLMKWRIHPGRAADL